MAEKCKYLGPQGDCRAPALVGSDEMADPRTRGVIMLPRYQGKESTRGSRYGCMDCDAWQDPVLQQRCQLEQDIVLDAAREGRIFKAQ
jgi:hypothetical protein